MNQYYRLRTGSKPEVGRTKVEPLFRRTSAKGDQLALLVANMPSLAIARRRVTENRWVQQSNVRARLRLSNCRVAYSLRATFSRFGRKLLSIAIVLRRPPQPHAPTNTTRAQPKPT